MAELLLSKLVAWLDPVRLVREAPVGLAAVERFLDQLTPAVVSLNDEGAARANRLA